MRVTGNKISLFYRIVLPVRVFVPLCQWVFLLYFGRSQYFSPLDDLAFDMYQDPDVAQVIRKLEKKKCDAVSSKYNIEMFALRSM